MAETPREDREQREVPGREAPARGGGLPREGTPEDADAREEEGWGQPESSAQKGPNATREPED